MSDQGIWSDTPTFHNTLVVGSSPTSFHHAFARFRFPEIENRVAETLWIPCVGGSGVTYRLTSADGISSFLAGGREHCTALALTSFIGATTVWSLRLGWSATTTLRLDVASLSSGCLDLNVSSYSPGGSREGTMTNCPE